MYVNYIQVQFAAPCQGPCDSRISCNDFLCTMDATNVISFNFKIDMIRTDEQTSASERYVCMY